MRLKFKEKHLALLFLLPSIGMIALFVIYPFFNTIWISFTDMKRFMINPRFIGVSNYINLFMDPVFWDSLKNTIVFTIASTILQVLFGIGVALVLNESFRGRIFVRGVAIFPYLAPVVGTILTWKWIFNYTFGIGNYLLMSLEIIRSPIAWLGNMQYAMITCILVNVWRFLPFVVVFVLARLQTIPKILYEAAKIDGASAWNRFRYVTLPHLKAVLITVSLLRTIWSFNSFELIYLLTGGGPAGATQILPILIYLEAFLKMDRGMGATIAAAMLIFLVLISMIFFKIEARERKGGIT